MPVLDPFESTGVMGTSYDQTTYLNRKASTAPFVSREASAAEWLRSSRHLASNTTVTAISLFSQLLPDFPEKAEDAVNKRIYIATRPESKRVQRSDRKTWSS
jgi:hypothetical protein